MAEFPRPAKGTYLGEYTGLRIGAKVYAHDLTTYNGKVYARQSTGTIESGFTPGAWIQLADNDIPAAVAAAIASDQAVKDATIVAVNAAAAGLDLLTAETVETDTAVFMVVDSTGRRSWLEVAQDGTPTLFSSGKIQTGLDTSNDRVAEHIAWTVLDPNGRMSDLTIGADGHLLPEVITRIAQEVTGSSGGNLSSVFPLYCWGDSITFGADLADPTTQAWPAILATTYGLQTVNRGISGQTSLEIAARQGGRSFTATVTGGAIPSSNPVTLTGLSIDPLRGGPASIGVTIAGVPGILSASGSTRTFTRSQAGSTVTVGTNPVDVISDGDQARGNVQIIWAGANDIATTDTVIADIARMTTSLTAIDARFLVLSVLDRGQAEGAGTTVGTEVRTVNTWLEKTYGASYLDIREYLVTRGLADAGITPTTQDSADIAADSVPLSLRSQVGSIHPNATATPLIAAQIYGRLRQRGWV